MIEINGVKLVPASDMWKTFGKEYSKSRQGWTQMLGVRCKELRKFEVNGTHLYDGDKVQKRMEAWFAEKKKNLEKRYAKKVPTTKTLGTLAMDVMEVRDEMLELRSLVDCIGKVVDAIFRSTNSRDGVDRGIHAKLDAITESMRMGGFPVTMDEGG